MAILLTLSVSILVNFVFFFFAAKYKTDKVTDLSYGLSFIAVVLTVLLAKGDFSINNLIVSAMVIAWAVRLATFLFTRINRMKRDKRFDGVRENFWSFFKFWFLQAISVAIIISPVSVFISKDKPDVLVSLSFAGIGLWIFGLVLETIADYQKSVFKSNQKNEGKFIKSGVWKYSRHPNYLGEILCWWGLFIFISTNLVGAELFTIASPFYITFLLIFVTGIPTIESKYADNKEYQKYAEETGVLLPKINYD